MKLKKKIKSGVLNHDILREFEMSKSTYYRFIAHEHVLLIKNLPKLKFLLIIFCLNCFHPFLIEKKGHSRVSIQNLPPHVLTWNFCHRFASMWSEISPNEILPRNSFFWELWRGKEKFKKWFFLKTARPISMKKIYVVETNEPILQKKEKGLLKKIVAEIFFWIFRNFFLRLCSRVTTDIFYVNMS